MWLCVRVIIISVISLYLRRRGNHETRSVNGWEEHYKEKSFLYQCKVNE